MMTEIKTIEGGWIDVYSLEEATLKKLPVKFFGYFRLIWQACPKLKVKIVTFYKVLLVLQLEVF